MATPLTDTPREAIRKQVILPAAQIGRSFLQDEASVLFPYPESGDDHPGTIIPVVLQPSGPSGTEQRHFSVSVAALSGCCDKPLVG